MVVLTDTGYPILIKRDYAEDYKGEKALCYEIEHINYGLVGYVGVVIEKIDHFEKNELCEKLRKKGLDCEELIVDIHKFFPNGKLTDWERFPTANLTRNGVGTKVLEIILEECKSMDVKAAYTNAQTPAMCRFSEKNRFEFIKQDDYGKHYIKYIN
jgi:hypothetical protein